MQAISDSMLRYLFIIENDPLIESRANILHRSKFPGLLAQLSELLFSWYRST